MRNKSLLVCMSLLMILCTMIIFSQEDDTEKELTVEELYLTNPEVMIIYEQAQSGDRQTKLEALDGIEKMMEDGELNSDVEIILISLGSEGAASKVYEGRTQINNFPEVRRRACNLLGKQGGERAVDALIGILNSENESMVMSEAAYALGSIGMDENGKVVKALAAAIEDQTVTNPDSNFAYAVILALQKLAERNKGLKDSSGYRALITIAQGNYIKGVKKMALSTLRDFKKYSQ